MFDNYIIIFINGEPFNCHQSMSIKDLLLYLNFNLDVIVVEYNKEIIDLSLYDSYFLKMNDAIEVITIVGGG
uniref:Thiamin biosynthesis protein S n=1 Tax=Dipterocladia arabiensis TaxID=2007176 RepID=A0A1Z1M0S1_9FLOR|nr:thiamin biosynthesis protein S [Dipterocladia arabiensis]ARW59472.1 thiamin biosynthesis protein S [Dipterocladia arabiensis]